LWLCYGFNGQLSVRARLSMDTLSCIGTFCTCLGLVAAVSFYLAYEHGASLWRYSACTRGDLAVIWGGALVMLLYLLALVCPNINAQRRSGLCQRINPARTARTLLHYGHSRRCDH
jgi:hypothetical protein